MLSAQCSPIRGIRKTMKPLTDEQRLNLNGEFLGVTSMAAYSAPWYLQVLLLILVGALFYVKVVQDSKSFRQILTDLTDDEDDQYLELLSELNRLFFGFTVARKNVLVYWIGFLIFLISLAYALIQTLAHLLY